MNRFETILFLATAFGWNAALFGQSPAAEANREPGFRPDRILVKLKDGANLQELATLHTRHRTRVLRRFKNFGTVDVVELPPVAAVPDFLEKFQTSGLIERAEPDYWIRAAVTPNDPRFTDGTQWNLRNTGQNGGLPNADIKAVAAWDVLNSASNIVVAVIDGGVRYTHQDLAANMWVNPGESGLDALGRNKRTNRVDDDANGIVDDVFGIDAVNNTGDPKDSEGHGTHVAGIIGAVGNNRIGVAGVAWKIQIMACRFLDSTGFGSTSDAIQCLDYARAKGAKVINASWGDTGNSSFLSSAIQRARDAGIIFVTASGNEGNNNDTLSFYPANFNSDNIVSVAATTRTDALASFSNFGATMVDLAAPGSTIYSTFNTSDSAYTYSSGTSMAVPHVTGAIALLRALHPNESYRQIINRVLATTDPLPSLAGRCATGGRLNLQRALTANLVADFTATPTAGSPPLTVQLKSTSVGENLRLEWDFGDGSAKSSAQTPTHQFNSEGNFTITLTVTDPSGNTSRKSRTISSVANYLVQTAAYNWIDPAGMTEISLSDNGVSAAQALPFSFNFYGQNYEHLYIGANGLIGFANQRLDTAANTDLPSPSLPNAVICPWWDDLNPPAGGRVRIGTVGTAPSRRTVVSWVNVSHKERSDYAFTFQVVLSEGSNEILFQYLQVQASRSRGAGKTATVGIENETGSVARRYSFDGSTLLRNNQAILFVPSSTGGIVVTPAVALNSSGLVGGPFSPSSQAYVIQNTAKSSLDWAARKRQPWLSLSATNGTLAAGQSVIVIATVNSEAQNLSAGSYLDAIDFINLKSGSGNTSRSVTLAVNGTNGVLEVTPPSTFASSGFVGGPFNPSTQIYTLVNTGDAAVEWTASAAEAWISLAPVRGTLAAGDGMTVTAAIDADANELADGTYTNRIAFANLTNGKGSAERLAVLTAISPTASLLISPPDTLRFTGGLGGPFLPAKANLALKNSSDARLEWTATGVPSWLTLSVDGGRLEAGQEVVINISANTNAAALPAGTHSSRLTFTSTGGGARATAEAALTIQSSTLMTTVAFDRDRATLRLRVAGEPGLTYLLEASANLVQWSPIATNVITEGGFFEVTELDVKAAPQRFYRVTLAP
ncbi:MAG: S8 family serine peptidase [Verrucomicrobia bacterium]|nr:S8 family serine peptidase [Verrucomicrobiota bacterium]